ncbi:MAG: bis(5'-nucleosyl)-tetraphosphatase (symmetrical) YqeK [Velocimicrobium sp.]
MLDGIEKIQEIQQMLEKELSKKRFIHTLSVSSTAACLSMKYGEDIKRARVAGLLHDCAKCLSGDELYSRCMEFGIEVSKTEEHFPYLLHAKLGAYYANTRFGVEDTDILNAIIYHTTGRPNMSLLEKIIYLSDYIEPERKEIPGLNEIRNIVFSDLDQAVYLTLENTLRYLKSQNKNKNEIDTMTINAYTYYKELIERGNGQ